MTPHDSFFRRSLYGLLAGSALGLFLGELVLPLRFVANGYIRLLQVNVLPYVLGSLIVGFGSSSSSDVRRMAGHAGRLLLPLWIAALLIVLVVALAFPPWEGTAVFSADPVTAPAVNWVEVYIPANVFEALSANTIPAVVLFGILAGLALGQMQGERKQTLLLALEAFNETMARISRMVVRLTPYGLFAIAAVTAGEIRLAEFIRLQVWIVVYAGTAVILVFWVLPGLATAMAPVSYRNVMGSLRGALVMAFAAGDAFVVLPVIAEAVKDMMKEQGVAAGDADTTVGVVTPLLYNFPHVGKVLTLGFLPFGAWFLGGALSVGQYVALAGAGFLSLFGNLNAAIPFLLDTLRLPADLFSLFATSSVINSRVGALASAMHNACVSLLVGMALMGRLRWDRRRLASVGVIGASLTLVFLLGTRVAFSSLLSFEPADIAISAAAVRGPFADAAADVRPDTPPRPGQRLAEVLQRGVLRVGYFDDAVPWSFVNDAGDPTGYDIEAAHALARECGTRLTLVRASRDSVAADLTSGTYDILMAGYTTSVARAREVEFSHPYAEEVQGLLVRDHDRTKFSSLAALDSGRRLRIAVRPSDRGGFTDRWLPEADVKPYESIPAVIDDLTLDAIVMPYDRALYWSRLRTEFAAIHPEEITDAALVGYAIPMGELELRNLVNAWVDVRRARGTLRESYAYWVRGEVLRARQPRWSVVRNVFGWGLRRGLRLPPPVEPG
jgi:Na+/H+-dicarboxylate symporter